MTYVKFPETIYFSIDLFYFVCYMCNEYNIVKFLKFVKFAKSLPKIN